MFYIKSFCFFLAFILGNICTSQDNFEGLGETGFAINYKASSVYSMNFALRSRYFLHRENRINFDNRQLDLVHFSTISLAYNQSLSLGIQYRFREIIDGNGDELRLTQQYNYTKRNMALRFGHRLRLEQRILGAFTIIRYRYRFTLDFPLNGEKLDVGEGYFITSMEALLSQSSHIKPEIDHRTSAHVGWQISEKLKLQLGLEYRFEAFNIKTEELFFIYTSAILNL